MSNLIRWEPEREMMTLREAMDHLFDEAFTRPLGFSRTLNSPSINVYETDDEVVVSAPLPGLKAEDVDISITGETLTIKGEFKEKEEKKAKAYHLHEQRYGSFERTLNLPSKVEVDKAKADFENGILSITLPKAESVKPKTITVKAK
jgi:HSP20 family protein